MSDATDFEAAALEITKTEATAVAVGATAAAAVPIVGEVIIAITALIYALAAIFDQTDEIQNAVQALTLHFDAILSAENQVLLMRDVSSVLAIATAQRDVVRELSPGQSLTDAQRALLDSNTDQVVQTLGDIAYWQRPFFNEAVYSDAWSGFLAPEPSLEPGSVVFDYRLTMPAYLESIVIRLIAMLALDGQFKPRRREEVARIASQLEGYHDKIARAIVKIPAPTDAELIAGVQDSWWDLGGHGPGASPYKRPPARIYGAVETYSAYSAIDTWQDEAYDLGVDRRYFYNRLALGTLARCKKVYLDVGLHSVWSVVRRLKIIAEVPLTTTFDVGSDWSLAEVGDLLVAPAPDAPPRYSAIDLVALVSKSLPISFRDAFANW